MKEYMKKTKIFRERKSYYSLDKFFKNGRRKLKDEYNLILFRITISSFENPYTYTKQRVWPKFFSNKFKKIWNYIQEREELIFDEVITSNMFAQTSSVSVILKSKNYNSLKYFRSKFKKYLIILSNLDISNLSISSKFDFDESRCYLFTSSLINRKDYDSSTQGYDEHPIIKEFFPYSLKFHLRLEDLQDIFKNKFFEPKELLFRDNRFIHSNHKFYFMTKEEADNFSLILKLYT